MDAFNLPDIPNRDVKKARAELEGLVAQRAEQNKAATMLENRLAERGTPEAVAADNAAATAAVKAGKPLPGDTLAPARQAVADAHRGLTALSNAIEEAANDVCVAVEAHLREVAAGWEKDLAEAERVYAETAAALDTAKDQLIAARRLVGWAHSEHKRWPHRATEQVPLEARNGEPYPFEEVHAALVKYGKPAEQPAMKHIRLKATA
jgi:hypothetical protein